MGIISGQMGWDGSSGGVRYRAPTVLIKCQKKPRSVFIMTRTIAAGSWKSLMRPEMMNALIISPQKMSSINLLKFINYLKKNNQKSTKYEVALWEKLIHPLMPLVMIIFAIPFGFLQERSGGKFFKMFVGIIIGIIYQILNTMVRHLSLLNDWQPFISSLVPTLIFLSIGIFLINKFEYK